MTYIWSPERPTYGAWHNNIILYFNRQQMPRRNLSAAILKCHQQSQITLAHWRQ